MQIKEMREYLKDKVDTVPRSNKDVELLYRRMSGSEEIAETKEVVQAGEEWTYVGAGATPPHMINYMGMQVFVRGQPVWVTDPRVLEKIGGNRSFVQGKPDMEKYFEADEIAAKKAQAQREEDQKLQIMVERQNRKG